MLLILTRKHSQRVNYIFRLILEDILGLSFSVTHDPEAFSRSVMPKFSYGIHLEEPDLFFAAGDLLFETGISVRQIKCFAFRDTTAFFSVHDPGSALPFDPFAASFYLVSRYEEYLPHIRDEHGRFMATGSEAFLNGFLHKPQVNIWASWIGDLLKNKYPDLPVRKPVYSFVPTIDIDAAYAFRHKGITRTIGGFLNSLKRKDYVEVKTRIRVLLNREKDPFDTYETIFRMQSEFRLRPVFFLLMADYGPKDKNIPVNNRQFIRLIKLLADYAEVGIHPSYASFGEPGKLETEINRLSRILHRDVVFSRQHFLRLEFPHTYRNLINLEITDDFTMGYQDQPGFRASICTPFRFYDLDLDAETHLMIHPFAVMDGTLKDYLRLTPVQGLEIIEGLIRETRAVGGVFMPLWHNQSLNDSGEWAGWLKVFKRMVELGQAH